MRARLPAGVLSILFALSILLILQPSRHVSAAPALVQHPDAVANGATSVSVTITAPTANDLLVIICGANGAAGLSITAPTGFSTAKNENNTVSQGIFYKVAAGTEGTTATCSSGSTSTRLGIQLLEYSGMQKVSPLDAVNGTSSTGTSATPASGSVTTSYASDLIIAGAAIASGVTFTGAGSSFTLINAFANGGAAGSRGGYGSASQTESSAGTYSTTFTGGGTSAFWIGQIAAFKIAPAVAFAADIVDNTGASVASPSVSMTTTTKKFTCQTITGTLGVSTQKIRVTSNNPADANGWTLAMAATGGTSSTWTAGANTYKYNDATGSPAGCTNGQLTVDPTSETITPEGGCATTGVSALGSATAYATGTSSITIASANNTASYYCYWDITGLTLSQKIPKLQTSGSYSIGFTLTLTAL